ncbi:hypothetical protein O0L34_g3708 [Tuta absoluta]|nr:hypothetical protein O0L34_g3708 [Tuta absoluta]
MVEASACEVPACGIALVLLALVFVCVVLARLGQLGLTDTDNPAISSCTGSRYVSWLPSFSVEVTRVRAPPTPPHQLQHMARQVQQLFPQYGLTALLGDLAATRSADLTVNNILEGRLPPPLVPDTPPPHPPPPAPAPQRTGELGCVRTAQVQQLFPQYGLTALLGDLAATRSADLTVNNILEGRLPPPLVPDTPPPHPPPPAPAPQRTGNPETISAAETLQPPAPPAPAPAPAPAGRDAATNTAAASVAAAPQFVYHTDVGHTSTMFSKDASEREVQLQRRKAQLVAAARQKYLDKLKQTHAQADAAPSRAPAPSAPAPRAPARDS